MLHTRRFVDSSFFCFLKPHTWEESLHMRKEGSIHNDKTLGGVRRGYLRVLCSFGTWACACYHKLKPGFCKCGSHDLMTKFIWITVYIPSHSEKAMAQCSEVWWLSSHPIQYVAFFFFLPFNLDPCCTLIWCGSSYVWSKLWTNV